MTISAIPETLRAKAFALLLLGLLLIAMTTIPLGMHLTQFICQTLHPDVEVRLISCLAPSHALWVVLVMPWSRSITSSALRLNRISVLDAVREFFRSEKFSLLIYVVALAGSVIYRLC